MRKSFILPLAAASLLSVAAPVTIATAQEMQSPATPDEQMSDMLVPESARAPVADDYSSEQVDAFAAAYIQVSQIGMSYETRLQAAADEDEQRQLQEQAQGEMMTVIEGVEGLTVDDYNGIFVVAQNDPDFANQIQTAINAAAGGPAAPEGDPTASEGDAMMDQEG